MIVDSRRPDMEGLIISFGHMVTILFIASEHLHKNRSSSNETFENHHTTCVKTPFVYQYYPCYVFARVHNSWKLWARTQIKYPFRRTCSPVSFRFITFSLIRHISFFLSRRCFVRTFAAQFRPCIQMILSTTFFSHFTSQTTNSETDAVSKFWTFSLRQ